MAGGFGVVVVTKTDDQGARSLRQSVDGGAAGRDAEFGGSGVDTPIASGYVTRHTVGTAFLSRGLLHCEADRARKAQGRVVRRDEQYFIGPTAARMPGGSNWRRS